MSRITFNRSPRLLTTFNQSLSGDTGQRGGLLPGAQRDQALLITLIKAR